MPFARPTERRWGVRLARGWRAVAVGLAFCTMALPAAAKYRVDIDAPRPIRKLLEQHLDLARFAKREDISDDQFQFLVTATPEQVRDLVATEGYFSPVVRTDVRAVEGKRDVTVHVDPGPRTEVTSVDLKFEGPVTSEEPARENAARFAFSLRTGDPFTQSSWSDAKAAALKALQTRRYLGAKIARSEARIDPRKRTAALSVTFASGPTFTLGPLDISGVRRYPREIVTNVNPLSVGEFYDSNRIAELQRQMQNTPYYASVAIDVDSDVDKPHETPIHVKVSEYPYNSVRGGVGYATDTGAHVQGAYSYLNMFGAAWPLSVQGRLDQIQQYGQIQLSMPPGQRGWVNSALASYTSTDVSDTHIYSARIGLQRTRTAQFIDYAYSLQYYIDRLDQNAAGPVTSRALVPQWSWTRRNVDDPLFPRSGNLLHAEAGFALKSVASDASFLRGYARGVQYVPVGKRDLVLVRAELGGVFTSGSSSDIPASLLFRAGGSNSVRGYGFQSIGNNVSGSVLPTKYLLTATAEYQHWFSHNWGAAVFYDIGTATDTWHERTFFPGAGIGARWRSPVGPINLDLAYGLRNKSVRPYLTLGIAF
ncbi:autotransporter assembly complex protein TamA [Trinickia caryophylli]|nr:outer membrane protein assembly factor [Trinickia caryophylli]TRX20261.1 outer membrane protein assembly factor [Trinickia caryophylli]GLU35427.1 outer membrane protein assembly factor [Trinickia caryophylli]